MAFTGNKGSAGNSSQSITLILYVTAHFTAAKGYHRRAGFSNGTMRNADVVR
jgi:hypothetical protein